MNRQATARRRIATWLIACAMFVVFAGAFIATVIDAPTTRGVMAFIDGCGAIALGAIAGWRVAQPDEPIR